MAEFHDFGAPLYEIKANLFKGLAHPLRIRILEMLSVQAEVSVADLLAGTGLTPSHLSAHLAVLKRYRLVVGRRRGAHVLYSVAYPQVPQLLAVARALLHTMLEDTHDQLEHSVHALDGADVQQAISPVVADPAAIRS
jgi:DNA-binding transcriptional ArsR family regulator